MKKLLSACAIALIVLLVGCEPAGRSTARPPDLADEQHNTTPTPASKNHRLELPEIPFTAQGQEPGWQLRITDETIELSEHYGAEQSSFPQVEPTTTAGDAARYRTRNDDHELEILVEPSICRDSMSGMPHPATVRYTLDGETYNGCGGEPTDLLLGDPWQVVSIAGKAVLEDAVPTIEFRTEDSRQDSRQDNRQGDRQGDRQENRVGGLAGCNRFTGSFELTGEGLAFDALAVTRMACPTPDRQEQEQRFLDLMRQVRRFEMPRRNRLRLVGVDNRVIEAKR